MNVIRIFGVIVMIVFMLGFGVCVGGVQEKVLSGYIFVLSVIDVVGCMVFFDV